MQTKPVAGSPVNSSQKYGHRQLVKLLQHLRAPIFFRAMAITCGVLFVGGCKDADSGATAPGGVVEQPDEEDLANFHVDWPSKTSESNPSSTVADSNVRLRQVQQARGLQHTYQNGDLGKAYLVETIGGGGAWLDYDLDGSPDVYLNQGGDSTAEEKSGQPSDQLFRNRGGFFDNVSQEARIEELEYSQGVAVGDFDNDGFDDIYVSNVGANTLWWNCGDGTFLEVAQQVGVNDERWSASIAWTDLDRDGDLDLYVCNYCVYDPRAPKLCKDRYGANKICNPSELDAWPDACFINDGEGSFEDKASELGLVGSGNRALGVVAADFTNDGWPDIYVANDTTENFLFVSANGEKFEDEAPLRGCAVDRAGGPQGSMGLAVHDFDRNGFLDLYSTHYYEESNTLYANFGEQGFRDVTAEEGLHRPTLNFLAFGTVFADLDSDSRPELIILNGHVDHSEKAVDPRMKAQIFSMVEKRRWQDIADVAGDFFQAKRMGRGLAIADFDLDGDQDLLCVPENDEVALLENTSTPQGRWLKLRFHGTQSNRRGIGCRVTVKCNEFEETQELCGGTSFAVSHEPILHFGIGKVADAAKEMASVEVSWPSGRTQTLTSALDSTIEIVEP